MVITCNHPAEADCFICETTPPLPQWLVTVEADGDLVRIYRTTAPDAATAEQKALTVAREILYASAEPFEGNEYDATLAEENECPECLTTLDEDGYCTDPGCINCGKTA